MPRSLLRVAACSDAMCGRFVVARASGDVVAECGVDIAADDLQEPSWNIKPTQMVNAVLESAKGEDEVARRLEAAGWSIVPPGPPTCN